jgi:pyruvate, water dikinase
MCISGSSVFAQSQYYKSTINSTEEYQALCGKPLTDLYTNVQALKIVYDISSKDIYYLNSKNYPFHHSFCEEVLHYSMDVADFNTINYSMHPQRRYVLACINYYLDSKQYILEFVSEDSISAELLSTLYQKISATFTIGKPSVLLNNQNLLPLSNLSTINTITPNQLYGTQQQQSLVVGTAYGYLRFVDNLTKEINDVKANEIIVIHGSPLALPLCKGVISDALQTPLSHINVLCNNRKTPAAAWLNIFNEKDINALNGKPVKFTVTKSKILVEPCAATAVTNDKKTKAKQSIISDVSNSAISLFNSKQMPSAKSIGNKAMGVWHLQKIQSKHAEQFDVPKGTCAIPFYYYKQHLQNSQVKKNILRLQQMLQGRNTKAEDINKQLKAIRSTIKDAPINATLLTKIQKLIASTDSTARYRFRSSSNAEDLPGFNGAGLYASYSGSLVDTSKPIDQAIKKVWASVWSEAAFWEREYFNINQNSVMMAVLVHQGFPAEQSNGVAITKNLLRDDFPGYMVNAQYGEVSVVAPAAGVTCDQFVIIPSDYFIGEEGKTYAQYITKSSIAKDNSTVLNPKQVQQLYTALTTVKDYFYNMASRTGKAGSYDNFGLDLEFKFNNDKLILKQVRPFK